MTANGDENVVLLDEHGHPIGAASKSSVHTTETPLHLAFSCYVLDGIGRVLITRRSLSKRTWPGVWSNSFCGHPRPSETLVDALHRHAEHELGLMLVNMEIVLPVFRYRATDASGVVENEICPVYIALAASKVRMNPEEVIEHTWVEPLDLGEAIRLTPQVFSPWLARQAELMPLLGGTGTSRWDADDGANLGDAE